MRRTLLGFAALCALAQPALAQAPAAPATPPAFPAQPNQGGPMPETQAPPNPAAPVPAENPLMVNYQPVTDEILANPDAEDWLMLRGRYEGWGYSELDQINKDTVGDLDLVWGRAMNAGINEAGPIVYDGIMFLPNPADVIQAINAVTGDLIWEYRRELPTVEELHSRWGERKRSIFLYEDKVFLATWDNFIVALDAKSGQVVWETNRGGDYYASNSSGPIVVNGVVIAGATCQVAPFGCYVTGHDAETGEELWRNEVIPRPGQPGDETWAGAAFENRWCTGVWGQLVYDEESDLVHYGSTGICPAGEAQRNMPGATMAGTNTRYAVRPETGEIVWNHQVLPRDNWDQECTFEMMVIDSVIQPNPNMPDVLGANAGPGADPVRTLTGIPCKTGVLWSFNSANGDFYYARGTNYQNLITSVDNATGAVTINEDVVLDEVGVEYFVCPTYGGGRDWPSGAYSPQTNAVYYPLMRKCIYSTARTDRDAAPQFAYNTRNVQVLSPGEDGIGMIMAVDVTTGDTLWTWKDRSPNYSPILATAGGLIFNGGSDRYLRAHDAETGDVLWRTRLPSRTFGYTITYEVDGVQYVAHAAGAGFEGATALVPEIDGPTGSNAIYVFALDQ
ncbi:MAG: PQQ-binding-like beta-propeller repeat protein [Bauldia sp.]|nr:PQQ-binding-like beta-propeller repeat protein [Bauldia sp.]